MKAIGKEPSQEQMTSLLDHFQKGRVAEAEKLAISITQEFAEHPFGWKVLGSILDQTGRSSEALDANQRVVALSAADAEAHSNLGNTLKELGRLTEAEACFVRAIELRPTFAEAHYNLGNTLQELGRLEEAVVTLKQALALKPDFVLAHCNLGNLLKEQGKLEEAEALFRKALDLKPDFLAAYSNLGNTLQELGRLEEALATYGHAIFLKPDFVEVHYNSGLTLKQLGRLDEAVASYTRAIEIKPDYAEAHNNLGLIFQELGRLEEAQANLTQAIALNPRYANAHHNLGITLSEFRRHQEAGESYAKAIKLKPDFIEAKINLSVAIKKFRFSSSDSELYPILTDILTNETFSRPRDMANGILSLLKHDPLIEDILSEGNMVLSIEEAISKIESLDNIKLLHHLMRLCSLPDLQFERFFVNLRSILLRNLDKIQASPELVYFLSTLSLHCFTNEYVYVEFEEESRLVRKLESQIIRAIAKSQQPEAIEILCLACYRPLDQYEWVENIQSLDHLLEVRMRLIDEPRAEKLIARNIAVLGEVSNDVSCAVRAQYEENPYPRWVKAGIQLKPKSISEVCDETNLMLHSETIKNTTEPLILVAGCGTGQHSIDTASRFSGCKVTAVDLSLASLAFAQRKTDELLFRNVEYLQADILELGRLEKKFDIIESSGVLHHMEDPMVGWEILTSLLKPDGLMRIGLYSELARRHIVRIRKEIALLKTGTSTEEIRKFRQSIVSSKSEHHQSLFASSDFFSLSPLRDLLFHAQEHLFSVLKIQDSLDQLGLKFCGFEDMDINSKFKEFHGEDADALDLALWHQFEESSPDSFAAMYQFWCQKL